MLTWFKLKDKLKYGSYEKKTNFTCHRLDLLLVRDSVADPDPNPDPDSPDPHVFGPFGSGSISQGMDPDPDPDLDPSIIMKK
jgi:hypothetical protein